MSYLVPWETDLPFKASSEIKKFVGLTLPQILFEDTTSSPSTRRRRITTLMRPSSLALSKSSWR